VGSTLADHANDPAAGPAKLRRHRVGEDLKLLGRINGQKGEIPGRVTNLIVGQSVDHEPVGERWAAADINRRRTPGLQNLAAKCSDASYRWNQIGQPQ